MHHGERASKRMQIRFVKNRYRIPIFYGTHCMIAFTLEVHMERFDCLYSTLNTAFNIQRGIK